MFDTYRESLKSLLDGIECLRGSKPLNINEAVGQVVSQITNLKNAGKTMFWIGNGGSAAIAVHSTLDYFRTGNIKTQAFYDGPMLTCLGNDFGYPSVFQKPLSLFATPGDMLMAISSSGKSANILNAVETAREKGCFIVTLSGFGTDNPLRSMGDLNFYVAANHYGHVELCHAILCHAFLDLFMAEETGGR